MDSMTGISQQMLAAIKLVADGNFVFQQDSTPAHCARNTVQLPTSFLLSWGLWPPTAQSLLGSHEAAQISVASQ